jgi:hypothetical protein
MCKILGGRGRAIGPGTAGLLQGGGCKYGHTRALSLFLVHQGWRAGLGGGGEGGSLTYLETKPGKRVGGS